MHGAITLLCGRLERPLCSVTRLLCGCMAQSHLFKLCGQLERLVVSATVQCDVATVQCDVATVQCRVQDAAQDGRQHPGQELVRDVAVKSS